MAPALGSRMWLNVRARNVHCVPAEVSRSRALASSASGQSSAKQACGSPRTMSFLLDGLPEPVYYVNVRALGSYTQPGTGTVGLMTRGECGNVYFGETDSITGLEATPIVIEPLAPEPGSGPRWYVLSDPAVVQPVALCGSATGPKELIPLAIDLIIESASNF